MLDEVAIAVVVDFRIEPDGLIQQAALQPQRLGRDDPCIRAGCRTRREHRNEECEQAIGEQHGDEQQYRWNHDAADTEAIERTADELQSLAMTYGSERAYFRRSRRHARACF